MSPFWTFAELEHFLYHFGGSGNVGDVSARLILGGERRASQNQETKAAQDKRPCVQGDWFSWWRVYHGRGMLQLALCFRRPEPRRSGRSGAGSAAMPWRLASLSMRW